MPLQMGRMVKMKKPDKSTSVAKDVKQLVRSYAVGGRSVPAATEGWIYSKKYSMSQQFYCLGLYLTEIHRNHNIMQNKAIREWS